MTLRPGRILPSVAMITILAALSGCLVVKSVRGEKGADVHNVQPGANRTVVDMALGPPLRDWMSGTVVRYALYEYDAGIPPSYGDAIGHAILDLVLVGAWEIPWAINGKHPGEYNRRRARVVVSYDEQDTVLGIFDEFDELPPDGRSGPYRWER